MPSCWNYLAYSLPSSWVLTPGILLVPASGRTRCMKEGVTGAAVSGPRSTGSRCEMRPPYACSLPAQRTRGLGTQETNLRDKHDSSHGASSSISVSKPRLVEKFSTWAESVLTRPDHLAELPALSGRCIYLNKILAGMLI